MAWYGSISPCSAILSRADLKAVVTSEIGWFILESRMTGNSKQGRQIPKIRENAVWGCEPVIIFKKLLTSQSLGAI
jgi:hypothetical protein